MMPGQLSGSPDLPKVSVGLFFFFAVAPNINIPLPHISATAL